jgi:hypothetical protein
MDLPEFGILDEDNALDTRERVISAYVDIAMKARKPADQIRALDKIAELRGFKVDRMITDLKKCSPEELESLIEDWILPALGPYNVKGRRREVVDDVPLDD